MLRGATHRAKAIALVRRQGIIRTKELAALGLQRTYLRRLVEERVLIRVARGVYRLAGALVSNQATLAEAAKRVPEGVVCLLSALQFHETGTQLPAATAASKTLKDGRTSKTSRSAAGSALSQRHRKGKSSGRKH